MLGAIRLRGGAARWGQRALPGNPNWDARTGWVDVGRAGCPQHAVGARLTSATPGMHSDGHHAPREKPEIQVFQFRVVNRQNGSELAFREGQHCQAGGLTHKGCDLAELAE